MSFYGEKVFQVWFLCFPFWGFSHSEKGSETFVSFPGVFPVDVVNVYVISEMFSGSNLWVGANFCSPPPHTG